VLWLALASLASAQPTDTEVGFILRPEVAIDLANDREGEDPVEMRSRFDAFARGDLARGRWFIGVRGQHDLLVGQDVEGYWEARVHESGWQGPIGGAFDLRVGNLIERWGKLDYLSQADILNPRDLRSGFLTPTDWLRLPIPMAVVGVGTAPVRGELVLIPFASADRISLLGTDWSLLKQDMLEQQFADMSQWEGLTSELLGPLFSNLSTNLADLDPTMRRGYESAVNQLELPQSLVYNGEIAGRIELEVPGLDAAVMGGNMRSRLRATNINPNLLEILQEEELPDLDELQDLQNDPLLATEWPRTWFAGAEWSTLAGPIGIRGEGLYKSHHVVPRPWLRASTTPLVSAGIGLDYLIGSSFYAAVEGSYRRMLNPPNLTLLEPPELVQVGGGVRWTLAQDRLELQLGGLYNPSQSEGIVLPRVAYRASDRIELELGAVILEGANPPPDSFVEALTYGSGPASYFSQNDSVTAAVSWIL